MRMTMLHGNKTPDDLKRWIEEVSSVTVTSITIVGQHAEVTYTENTDYTIAQCDWEGVECVMCGIERSLNVEGYCSKCWQVWNS